MNNKPPREINGHLVSYQDEGFVCSRCGLKLATGLLFSFSTGACTGSPDATSKYELLVRELRSMPERMAEAWGGDKMWITTGTNVADLVKEWLNDTIEEVEAS